jgi:uncharacterized protein YqeY
MDFNKRIATDLKEAMKSKDQASLRGVRAIKAAILLAQTDGSGEEVTEDKFISIVQKLIKQRKDSLDIYNEQGREDLAKVEREEIEVISRYLPEQLSEEDLAAYIKDLITKLGASSMKDMGRVMGVANQELKGKAEGKAISMEVKKQLTA